jgi:colicin import membrane protein
MATHSPHSIPQEPGRWSAVTLAVIMHALLFAFLWIGIRWQSQKPAAVEAEVWNIETKEAAPRVQPQPRVEPEAKPEPKPEPKVEKEQPVEKKPDIAMEREKIRKEKLAREREEAEQREEKLKQEKALEEKKKKAEALAKKKEQEQLDKKVAEKIHAEEMKRLGIAGTGGTGEAPKSQGLRGDPDYVGKLAAKIKTNTIYAPPPDLQGNPSVEFTVELFPDGTVQRIKKLRSSGLPKFDEAVERAIKLSEPYPRNKAGELPPFTFTQTPKPKE